MSTVYEVIIVEKPTQKQIEEEGAMDKIVLGPVAVVAKNEQTAGIAAASTDKEFEMNGQMQVLVRPFV